MAQSPAGGEQPGLHAVLRFLRGVIFAQQIAQFGAGHLALEFGAREHRGEETVLIEQHAFVEGHVGDANGAFVAQRRIVAEDGDFVNRAGFIRVEAAMAVVIANGVGGAQIRHPSGFEQRDQPRLMLAGYRDRPRDRERQRASHADGAIENLVDAAQIRAAERGQAMREEFVEGGTFIHPPDANVPAGGVGIVRDFLRH